MSAYLESFMRQGTSTKAAIVVSTVCATGLAAYLNFFRKSGGKKKLAPALTEEEAQEILSEILDKIKLSLPKIVKIAENIKQQYAMQGQELDDHTLLKSFVLPKFEGQLQEIQTAVLEEHDACDDEFEEAINEYLDSGDEDITELANTLRTMYEQIGGEIEKPEDKSVDSKQAVNRNLNLKDLTLLIDLLTERMLEKTTEFCSAYIEKYGTPTDMKSMERFQLGLLHASEDVEKNLLKERGLKQSDLQNLITKYQNERSVQEAFHVMKMLNQQVLQSHGVPVMDQAMHH
jgi:hypothetical protein